MSTLKTLQRAHEAFEEKKYDVAETLCLEALKDDPNAHKAHQILFFIARARGEWDKAEAALVKALEIEPKDAECLNSYGNLLAMTSRNFKAIEAYENSLKYAPNYPNPAMALGNLHLRVNDPAKAVSVLRSSLEHNPQNQSIITSYLNALTEAQRYEEVSAVLNQLPSDPSLALIRGLVASVNNQMPVARGAFVQAMAHPASSHAAFKSLVQLEWQQGGSDAGQALIQDMIKNNPDAGMLYLGGADILGEIGLADEGIDLLEEAEKKFGEQPNIFSARSKLWVELGEGAAAKVQAEKALRAQPGDIYAISHYVRAMLMLGDFNAALQVAKATQMRQPHNQFWVAIEAIALKGLGQSDAYGELYGYDLVRSYDLDAPPEYKDKAEFLSELKNALIEQHDESLPLIGQTVRGGVQTTRDLRFAKSRVIQDFFQVLNASVQDYIDTMPQSDTHPLFRRKRESYRLSGAWSARLNEGGFHINHVHPAGWVSAAFYVDVASDIEKAKDKAGWIEFGRPPFEVPGCTAEHSVAPAPGRLVLFPSYMWHGTVPIKGDVSRLTLSFDVVPA